MKVFATLIIIFITLHISAQVSIVPEPKKITLKENEGLLYSDIGFSFTNVHQELGQQLLTDFLIKRLSKLENKGAQTFSVDHNKIENPSQGFDYHKISIDKNGILISYTTKESALLAARTLIQLIEFEEGRMNLPFIEIEDYAGFSWRGLHLDCSRHFFEVEEVERFIELMSQYKFNTFHWHLTDDQGWRIEIKKYPKLTEVGSKRRRTLKNHYNTIPRTWDENEYGGFYTQEDIKRVVAFAQSRGVTVVPEIELPGHSMAALSAYPKLSCTDEKFEVPGKWGVFNDVYCSEKKTMKFLKNVLREVCDLFPSEYIHIGGDEAPVKRWEECRKCQKNMRKHDLHSEHELQGWMIGEISNFLTKKGKKMIGWDEILDGGLAENSAVMSWRGFEGGIKAANQNHPVVMTPTEFCYFDYYQSDSPREPLAIGGYLPLSKVYAFNPIPQDLDQEKHQYILGGQANVWTEYMKDFKQVEYMTYPRALALSEKLWSKSAPSFQAFVQKLSKQFEQLELDKVNFSKAIYDVEFIHSSPEPGVMEIEMKTLSPEGGVQYAFVEDGGYQSLTDYTGFLRFETEIIGTRKIEIVAVNDLDADRRSYTKFLLSPSLGTKVDTLTKPHSKYSNNLGFTLTDGIKGQRPWKGSEWLGYSGDTIEILFDFGEIKDLKGTEVSCLSAPGSWIYLPTDIRWYFSKDNIGWSAMNKKMVNNQTTILPTKRKTRYIKIVICPRDIISDGNNGAGHSPWTFIDEISFLWK